MLERILGPLPPWSKLTHPLLKYELRAKGTKRRRWRIVVAYALLVIVLLAVGVIVATQLTQQPLSPNISESLSRILYAPVMILQLVLIISALSLTTGAIGEAIRKQQWDSVRVTEGGAGIALRTRWASIFYRLRPLLLLVLLARLALIIVLLWDLTAFQGEYLDLLTAGITPNLSLMVGDIDLGLPISVLLLSMMLTAGILLPLTTLALDAAFGLLLSTFVRQRTYTALVQFVLVLLRLALMAALGYTAWQFISGDLTLGEGVSFMLMFGFGALVDWGLYFLHLGSYGELWALVPYGVLLSLALVAFALLQAFIANRLLLWAIQRAQNRG
jgi:hypothetical protein